MNEIEKEVENLKQCQRCSSGSCNGCKCRELNIDLIVEALTEKLQREENKPLVSDFDDMHCDECPLIDYCNGYEDTPPCCQPRFENVSLKDFLSVVDYIQNKSSWDEDTEAEESEGKQ